MLFNENVDNIYLCYIAACNKQFYITFFSNSRCKRADEKNTNKKQMQPTKIVNSIGSSGNLYYVLYVFQKPRDSPVNIESRLFTFYLYTSEVLQRN